MPTPLLGVLLLSDTARRLLGISPEVGQRINEAELYFAGGWPVRAAALALIAGTLWFGYLYLKDGTPPLALGQGAPLGLRLLALSALIAMLFQPMLRLRHSQVQRGSVVVLVDDSQSMGIRDDRLPPARAAQVARATGGTPAR